MSTHLRLTQLALVASLALSAWGTFGLMETTGTIAHMKKIEGSGSPLLPGTSAPLKTVYTGIGPIDYQLTVLCVFFRSTMIGDHPEYSLHLYDFAFQFAVQYGLVVVEGSRPGNAGRIIS